MTRVILNRKQLKLPPYGSRIVDLRRQGFSPSGWLYVDRMWPKKPRAWSVVVPADDDPTQYDLVLCTGLAVMVSCTDSDNGNEALVEIIEAAKPADGVVLINNQFSAWLRVHRP